MLQQNALAIALFLGIVVGCVTNEVVRHSTVRAQNNGEFTECVAYTLDYDGDLEDLGANAKPITGWTPVGGVGAGGPGWYAAVLCR